jgi:hypothetical protein
MTLSKSLGRQRHNRRITAFFRLRPLLTGNLRPEADLRTARPGDGHAIFHVARQSIAELPNGLYTPEQLNGWMGERIPEFYEQLIKARATGRGPATWKDRWLCRFLDASLHLNTTSSVQWRANARADREKTNAVSGIS